ncbi:hypothetical protein MTTB_00900 [Methanothermobacter tenebrarum]|jgi:hypothetical protein|uniref:Uncharacterized protein n=1 Tax=Methanothermobacter tenebrarum TaxID=680118 RepID=A0ABN6PDK9_9EURY|nr:hypothetical protein MTTB_00900 [Methanothermobacter tenebrarum]
MNLLDFSPPHGFCKETFRRKKIKFSPQRNSVTPHKCNNTLKGGNVIILYFFVSFEEVTGAYEEYDAYDT